MIVAIVAAVRTGWKDEAKGKDEWYFWRNAMSNIWYSSEIVGTIIVQCIPVLRPLLRDLRTSLTSKRLASGANRPKDTKRSNWNWTTSGAGFGANGSSYTATCWSQVDDVERGDAATRKGNETVELRDIPEESEREQDSLDIDKAMRKEIAGDHPLSWEQR